MMVRMSRGLTLLFAVAAGLSVANIYVAQPLLAAMAGDFGIPPAEIGLVVTITQAGYALGLVFIVPAGDMLDRRRLLAGQAGLSAIALLAVGLSPGPAVLFAGLALVGLLAVAVQGFVAFAASLAADDQRGRVIGTVTGGVVTGILLARVVAGTLADLGGWRAVYLVSAAASAILGIALFRLLPCDERRPGRSSYPALVASVARLWREERTLRVRGTIACLIFAAFSVFWSAMVLPLSAQGLSPGRIGLFGLAGAIGAAAAGRAGMLADRGLGRRVTMVSLALLVLSWLPLWLGAASFWLMAAGVILLDLAIQAVHVTNQAMILAARPDARSRLVGAYMTAYSFGSGLGSIAATQVYGRAGWTGVCLLGAAISLVALVFWRITCPVPPAVQPGVPGIIRRSTRSRVTN